MEKMYSIYNKINKVTYKGKCLWDNCDQKSIKSHSHTKSLLRNISLNNKIYGVSKNFISWHKGEFFREFGINEASTFHGFCPKHDSSLFKSVEDHELKNINKKAAFLLLARSVFFEYYQKRTITLKINKLTELCKENNLDVNEKNAQYFLSGAELFTNRDFPAYEKNIYKIVNSDSYDGIQFLYKKINKPMDISLSTLINPLFNEFLLDKYKEQPMFSLQILPYKNYGLIVLSWLKKYSVHMNWIEQEFNRNFNKLINYLCFLESQDFYFSVKLYNLSIRKHKNFFKKAFSNRVSHPDFDWGETKLLYDFDEHSSF